jgi:hypothetical protein
MNSTPPSPEAIRQPEGAAGLRAARGSAVLFLDVDGVLNRVGTRERSPHGTYGVETAKVELLCEIVGATDCDIVVSSTWRKYDDLMTHLHDRLENLSARIIGTTPVLDRRTDSGLYVAKVRGDEIQAWLDEHPEVNRFVIVDDDSDMAHLAPHLVKTNGREGLTAELTDDVIRRLNGRHEP